jgi:hypothetical protein
LPHILLSSNPQGAGIGGTLGLVGLLGLIALVAWAILPRWRSILPRAVQRPIVAVGLLGALRVVHRWVGGYERWRSLHRLTGLFVGIGFLRGLMNGTAFGASPALRWSYVAIGPSGSPSTATGSCWPGGSGRCLLEISLALVGRPMLFTPGQFAMVSLEARDGHDGLTRSLRIVVDGGVSLRRLFETPCAVSDRPCMGSAARSAKVWLPTTLSSRRRSADSVPGVGV